MLLRVNQEALEFIFKANIEVQKSEEEKRRDKEKERVSFRVPIEFVLEVASKLYEKNIYNMFENLNEDDANKLYEKIKLDIRNNKTFILENL